MANPIDIRHHRFNASDRLLVDANVWMFVHGPLPCPSRLSDAYSKALLQMRASKCQVFIDILILSEFVNRFARIEFDQTSPSIKPANFKQYRDSTLFAPVAREIAVNVRKILSAAAPCESGFAALNVNALLNVFEAGKTDFNDQVIGEICKSKSLSLVTNDADFGANDIPILTANNRLLHRN